MDKVSMVISEEQIYESYSRACVADKRYICLFFSEPDAKEISSVKIIGYDDDPADWLAVAKDVGRQCVALLEFNKPQSLSLEGINIRVMETICHKLVSLGADLATGRLTPTDWTKCFSVAEIALANVLLKRGAMADISNEVFKVGTLIA